MRALRFLLLLLAFAGKITFGQGLVWHGNAIWQTIPEMAPDDDNIWRTDKPMGSWEPIETTSCSGIAYGFVDKQWSRDALVLRFVLDLAAMRSRLKCVALHGDIFLDWQPRPDALSVKRTASCCRYQFLLDVASDNIAPRIPADCSDVAVFRSQTAIIYRLKIHAPKALRLNIGEPIAGRTIGFAFRLDPFGGSTSLGMPEGQELKRSFANCPYLYHLHVLRSSGATGCDSNRYNCCAYNALNGNLLLRIAVPIGEDAISRTNMLHLNDHVSVSLLDSGCSFFRYATALISPRDLVDPRITWSAKRTTITQVDLAPDAVWPPTIVEKARQDWLSAGLSLNDPRFTLLLAALGDYTDGLAFGIAGVIGHQQWSFRREHGTLNPDRAFEFIRQYVMLATGKRADGLRVFAWEAPNGATYPLLYRSLQHGGAIRVVLHPYYVHYTRFEFIDRTCLDSVHRHGDNNKDGVIYLYGGGNNFIGTASLEFGIARKLIRAMSPAKDAACIFEGQSLGATAAMREACYFRGECDGVDARSGDPVVALSGIYNFEPKAKFPLAGLRIRLSVGEKDEHSRFVNENALGYLKKKGAVVNLSEVPNAGHDFPIAPLTTSRNVEPIWRFYGDASQYDPNVIAIGVTPKDEVYTEKAAYIGTCNGSRLVITTNGIYMMKLGVALRERLPIANAEINIDGQNVGNAREPYILIRNGPQWRWAERPEFSPLSPSSELLFHPLCVVYDERSVADNAVSAEVCAEKLADSEPGQFFGGSVRVLKIRSAEDLRLLRGEVVMCTSLGVKQRIFGTEPRDEQARLEIERMGWMFVSQWRDHTILAPVESVGSSD